MTPRPIPRSRNQPRRLFWKFFALISIVQIGSILVIGAWIYSKQRTGTPSRESSVSFPATIDTRQNQGPAVLPLEPVVGGALASLGSAALLAWLISKPIRSLQSALTEAANGNLNVRVADRMGSGNDELKDLGVEFDRMILRLRTLIDAQRQLLNDVSHEMRSPMARIQAAIGLAHQQPDQAPVLMERIQRESVRIDKLIGELLALSRQQADVDNQMNEDIELRDLLSDIVDDARFEATATGQSVDVVSQIDGVLHGNVELLRRAVDNVVRNAIKYSPAGGRIEVGTARGAGRGSVVISVRDFGTGVPQDDLGRVFEPFFRSATHARKEGSGLGLAIARRVVESHRGSIVALNATGGGLRVAIELPLLPEV